ncbi:MAG: tetraacyldisaccharide 4'-kinase, partial [candidate division WS1 bacterium]|nr:tetraacyldisaccharide 4'-kinase [candidate division WS1 bacterium]
GKRREAVITVLAARTPAQVVLLDDGFQYFRMQRLLDLVLVDASRASPRERLFPAGRLREPWDHLARADSVWLTHVDQATPTGLEELEAMVERHSPLGPSVHTRHRLSVLRSPHGEHLSSAALAGQRVLAVSGLGNPRSFELSLAQAGAEVVPCRFSDHHPYSPGDLLTINDRIEDNQPHLVVTTEKDAVKLARLAMTAKQDFRRDLWVAECELELLRGAEQVETQLGCIAAAVRPE